MDDGNAVQWKSGEIFQNDEYANLYGKHRKYITTKILGNTCFLIKRPLLGIVKANVYFCECDADKLIDECYCLSKEKNIPHIEIRTSIKNDAFIRFPCEHRGTYVINLHEDIETIWKKLNKKARNQIRQAKRNNVEISITNSEKGFYNWWDIYKGTVKRKDFVMESIHLYKELFENNKFSRLFVAKMDSKIISGNFILLSDSGITWALGGSNKKYMKYRPNHLLQWEIIEWAKEQGYSYYDMGGALPPRYDANGMPIDEGRGEGPSAFKRKFGGEYKELYKYHIITDKIKDKVINILISARFKLIKHL